MRLLRNRLGRGGGDCQINRGNARRPRRTRAWLVLAGILAVGSLIISLGTLPAGEPTEATRANTEREPIYTRQRLFSIPFYLNPQARPPQEVLLYVSGNQGESWALYQRRRALDQKFDFQAGEDGEYWFVVRTDQDPLSPDAVVRPEKVVIVDTTVPKLTMSVEARSPGSLQSRWTINDHNLDQTTFRLQYQFEGDEQWQPVTVDLPVPNPAAAEYSGEVTWTAGRQQGTVRIRAAVLDRAGNTAEHSDQIELSPTSPPIGHTEATGNGQDLISLGHPDSMSSPSTSAVAPIAPVKSPMTAADTAALPDPLRAPSPAPRDGSPKPLPWEPQPAASGLPPRIEAGPSGAGETANWSPRSSRLVSDPGAPGQPSNSGSPTATPSNAPFDYVFRSDDRDRPWSPTATSGASVAPHSTGSEMAFRSPNMPEPMDRPEIRLRPPREVPMTASSRFNLDYELVDITENEVARVELWITDNDGQDWRVYGTDSDQTSPFAVEVQQEGIYGFRLLIQDQRGSSASPPKPGDTADLWVGVDWTRPEARLVSARIEADAAGPAVDIIWTANDSHLLETPIRLSYAASPQEPWTALGPDLPNLGRHRWRPSEELPDTLFLQMEVRDRAGNVTRDQLPTPITIRERPPQGRIQRFEPAAE